MIDITNEIRDVVESYANLYREAIKNSGHSASGQLANFSFDIEYDGRYFDIIFELEDYWKYLENGRKAGKMPPIDAILQWIRVKPIVPRAVQGRVPDSRQLAFLIARKIGREGTPATHLMKDTFNTPQSDEILDKLIDLITTQIEEEINKDVEDEIS